MNNFVDKIKYLFEVDVTEEGESNKLVKVLRTVEFVLMVYLMIDGIFCLVKGFFSASVLFAVAWILVVGMFHLSYHAKVMTQILCINVFALVGIGTGYYLLGGDTHIHNYLFVLIVLAFFSKYGYYKLKAAYAVVIAVLYGFFQVFEGRLVPTFQLDAFSRSLFNVIDIVVVFVCIGLICYVYSKDSQHLEGKLLEYNNLLKKQACTDPLTGLCNRRSALELIDKLIKEDKEPGFCVCMCDIDYFKKVNDSYGHDIGDNVLRGIASTMLEGFPPRCLISRWGGEEFLVIFPQMNGDDAKMLLDIMRSKLKKLEYRAGDKKFGVTLTFGLAEYGFDGDADALVKEADNKLYYGKEHGRDQVVF